MKLLLMFVEEWGFDKRAKLPGFKRQPRNKQIFSRAHKIKKCQGRKILNLETFNASFMKVISI